MGRSHIHLEPGEDERLTPGSAVGVWRNVSAVKADGAFCAYYNAYKIKEECFNYLYQPSQKTLDQTPKTNPIKKGLP